MRELIKEIWSTSKRNRLRTALTGFAVADEFYSPDYQNKPLGEPTYYRRTLYWAPDIRLDAVDTPEFGTVVSGEATHSFTTNATRITVTEKRRWESNGVKHIELDFCRDC